MLMFLEHDFLLLFISCLKKIFCLYIIKFHIMSILFMFFNLQQTFRTIDGNVSLFNIYLIFNNRLSARLLKIK